MPFYESGINDLSISDDLFHNDSTENTNAMTAFKAAKKMGINVSSISICEPESKAEKKTVKKVNQLLGEM